MSPDFPVPSAVPPAGNPLRSSDGHVWDWLIESVGPASILVAIEARMGPELRGRYAVEDVWQDTLLQAWRDRAQCDWHGLAAFRRWLLQIAENRLYNLADRERTLKRGGGSETVAATPAGSGSFEPEASDASRVDLDYAGPVASTTPSRAASDAEQARRMRAALDRLPEELRTVVHLRLFDEIPLEKVAERIGLTVSGASRRFRRGFDLYCSEIERAMHGRTDS